MRASKLREGRSDAAAPNQVWAMDFVHDQLFDGRKLRVLSSGRPDWSKHDDTKFVLRIDFMDQSRL
jgi:hypothetical protein